MPEVAPVTRQILPPSGNTIPVSSFVGFIAGGFDAAGLFDQSRHASYRRSEWFIVVLLSKVASAFRTMLEWLRGTVNEAMTNPSDSW